MVGDTFFPGDTDYSVKEIPSDSEVKSAETLRGGAAGQLMPACITWRSI